MLALKAAPEYKLLPAAREHDIDSASWLWTALSPGDRRGLIDIIKHALSFHHFDAIAFSGLSGALVAPILAMEMNKTLLCVRRKGEAFDLGDVCDCTRQSHSGRMVEGDKTARSYVIVDDFTSTGKTTTHIFDEIFSFNPWAACIGILEYNSVNTDLTPVAGRQHEKWDLRCHKVVRPCETLAKFIALDVAK